MIAISLPTALLRGLLFLLGNIAVGVAITFACIVPVREHFVDREHEILQQRKALSRLRAVAARELSVEAQAKEATVGEGELLTGRTDGIISADLQARLKGAVEAAGAKLRSVRALQPKTDAQIRYIGSHIEAFGSIAAVHRAIHTIEGAKPYLFVTAATIRLAPPFGQSGGLPQEPLIEVQLDIFGAVRIEARER